VFLVRYWWTLPLGAIVLAAGIIQPIWMLASCFWKVPRSAAWRALRWLVAFSVVLVYISYALVIEPPQAHAFYLLAPLALVFAFYCWARVDSPRWRRVAAVVLGANIAFHAVLESIRVGTLSLYTNRAVVADAIRLKEPEIVGHRRAYAVDPGPRSLQDPSRPYEPVRDLKVLDPALKVGFGRPANWTLTIVNTNPRVAYRDILYFATYLGGDGRTVERHHEFIREIFQPGERRTIELNDGFAPRSFDRAVWEVAAAEALLPAPSLGRPHPVSRSVSSCALFCF